MSLAKLLTTRGKTYLGSIPEEYIKAIVEYVNNPEPAEADWDRIHSMIINTRSMRRATVWQAVCAIDPDLNVRVRLDPRTGRKWPKLPSPFTVARAVKLALEEVP